MLNKILHKLLGKKCVLTTLKLQAYAVKKRNPPISIAY